MYNVAVILLTDGIFGGAERRFTQLVHYLSIKNPDRFYFIVKWSLYNKILEVFPNYPVNYLIPIGIKPQPLKNKNQNIYSIKTSPTNQPNIFKQIYRFTRNYRIQKKYFNEIEKVRKEKNIKCFLGIYSGVIPLYFYLMKKKRNTSVLFCDMDSWFRDVLPNKRKYWYRKYSSFNYALENSDHIDFLSPFILKGVKDRGIIIKEDSVSITPCSFTDYSKCKIGNKNIFQVAFAGRLEKDKNPDMFLESANILLQKYPEIIFHIMGEGRMSANIQSQITNYKIKNIIYHGFHPQPTEILADTSVFVSIQTTNNYPSQSVLEAMGCGNAVIASDVGDTRMFVNEDNGILINLDAFELADAVERLYLDKDLCSQLGRFAFNYVRENHTVEKMAEYYITLFDNAYNKIKNK